MPIAKFKRLLRSDKGSVAIEFALVGPIFFGMVFMILDIALAAAIGSALDTAVHKTGRLIRTGQVAESSLTADNLKQMICDQLDHGAFGCSGNLLLKIAVVPNISQVKATQAIGSSGDVQVEETFNPGKSGDLISVEAFLPWPSVMNWVFSTNKTKDGKFVLVASDLFKNEPF